MDGALRIYKDKPAVRGLFQIATIGFSLLPLSPYYGIIGSMPLKSITAFLNTVYRGLC
jgi:hypothetical protein